jgi:anti-anti-sigma regulatory factor
MSIKTIMENSAVGKLAYTLAAAALIGGGTVVMNNQSRIAVIESTHVTEENRLSRIEDKLDRLLERLPR